LRRTLAALRVFQPLRAQAQERNRFVEQPFALMRIPKRLTNDSPRDTRAEIIGIVELVYRVHHFFAVESRILEVRKLVSARIGKSFSGEKAICRSQIVKLRAGIG